MQLPWQTAPRREWNDNRSERQNQLMDRNHSRPPYYPLTISPFRLPEYILEAAEDTLFCLRLFSGDDYRRK